MTLPPTPGDLAIARRANRRDALRWTLGGVAFALAAPGALAQPSTPTPANALGPFYPDRKPADSDADLTQVA